MGSSGFKNWGSGAKTGGSAIKIWGSGAKTSAHLVRKSVPIKAALADQKKVVKTGPFTMGRGRGMGGGKLKRHGQGQCRSEI